ncbi:SIS domain-containing protein [Leifsonia sp. LS-T14]|uniref:SIS domain-containing protein n=1 Tax=unclassified Leifsonia TaxID=2663824 RepID=UPI0035A5ABEA
MTSASTLSAYENGIMNQAAGLLAILDAPPSADADAFLAGVVSRFDGIVMTGMGSGPWAAYPAYLRLIDAGVRVWVMEAAELLNYGMGLLTSRNLLWITSQSGESAEIVALLENLPHERPVVLATVNDTSSTLARAADVVLPLHSGPSDDGVAGTGTFVNTIVSHARAVDRILGQDSERELADAPAAVAGYTADWAAQREIALALPLAGRRLIVAARGASLAAAKTGALLIKEAGKVHAEAMSAGEFRHGPIELVDSRFTAVVLEGAPRTAELNRRIAADVVEWGGQTIWLGAEGGPGIDWRIPVLAGAARPIAELLPLQVMSVAAGYLNDVVPGDFVHARRVTRTL